MNWGANTVIQGEAPQGNEHARRRADALDHPLQEAHVPLLCLEHLGRAG